MRIDLGLRRQRDVVRYLLVVTVAAITATAIGTAGLVADRAILWSEYWHWTPGGNNLSTSLFGWMCRRLKWMGLKCPRPASPRISVVARAGRRRYLASRHQFHGSL